MASPGVLPLVARIERLASPASETSRSGFRLQISSISCAMSSASSSRPWPLYLNSKSDMVLSVKGCSFLNFSFKQVTIVH